MAGPRKLTGNPGNLNIPELRIPEYNYSYSILAAGFQVVVVPEGATKALLSTDAKLWLCRDTDNPAAPTFPDETGDGAALIPAGSMIVLKTSNCKSFALVAIDAALVSVSWY